MYSIHTTNTCHNTCHNTCQYIVRVLACIALQYMPIRAYSNHWCNWILVEITRTYKRNEIKFRWICHALQNLALLEVLVINLSSAGIITTNHSEEIHDRTTDSELNKRFAFSPDFPVFIKIYDLAESSLSISFHGSNCCLEILVMKQRTLLWDFCIIYFRLFL